jgi:cbb3-type cytochrome oxidase subunit 3
MNTTWVIVVLIAGLLWWAYSRYMKGRRDREDQDKKEPEERE